MVLITALTAITIRCSLGRLQSLHVVCGVGYLPGLERARELGCGQIIGLDFEGGDEPIAPLRHSLDEPLGLPAVSDCFARSHDAVIEGRITDELIRPHMF